MNFFNKIRKMMRNLLHLDTIVEKSLDTKMLIHKYEQLSFLSSEVGVNTKENVEPELIVSLTTYGRRIHEVYLTIESLMQQSLKPSKIVLWLAKNEFNDSNIPRLLYQYVKRGLTISYCDDWKSYKKLVPTLIKYPDSLVITVDDDVIYLRDFIENLYSTYKEDPNCIVFNRGHKITFDEKKRLRPYLNWEWEVQSLGKSLLHVPTGIGGVLYPPNCFHQDVICSDIFMEICPTTDDLWFKVMALRNNVACRKSKGQKSFVELPQKDSEGLNKINNGTVNINDKNIRLLLEKYNLNNFNNFN